MRAAAGGVVWLLALTLSSDPRGRACRACEARQPDLDPDAWLWWAPGSKSGLIGSPGSVRTHAWPRVTRETRLRSQVVRCTPATRQSNRTILAESRPHAKF